jgi:hypothetical protein
MRQMYESDEDLERESVVVRALEMAWKCKMIKLPIKYHLDFVVTRADKAVAFCEIKTRNYTWAEIDAFGGYLISIDKWMSAENLNRISGLPFLLIVKAKDDLYYATFTEFKPDDVVVRGRTDRKDWQDIEPCVLLDTKRFNRLVQS